MLACWVGTFCTLILLYECCTCMCLRRRTAVTQRSPSDSVAYTGSLASIDGDAIRLACMYKLRLPPTKTDCHKVDIICLNLALKWLYDGDEFATQYGDISELITKTWSCVRAYRIDEAAVLSELDWKLNL